VHLLKVRTNQTLKSKKKRLNTNKKNEKQTYCVVFDIEFLFQECCAITAKDKICRETQQDEDFAPRLQELTSVPNHKPFGKMLAFIVGIKGIVASAITCADSAGILLKILLVAVASTRRTENNSHL